MGETHQQEQHQQQQARPPSRFGIKNMGGEIVEVQGGHIVRSTGRKDRHSKVCTAKGPRDRRVRLSAHTAIQFYDVQDRLGYDRPSKAVDWLIKKAKTAIDELAELPAWHPTATAIATSKAASDSAPPPPKTRSVTEQEPMSEEREYQLPVESLAGTGSDNTHRRLQPQPPTRALESMQQQQQASSFLPASLDSDSIANTIKSFFPLVASGEAASSSPMQFQNYPPDLLSRTSSHTQDLRLSLQSFQDPNLLHRRHHEQQHHQHAQNEQIQLLFSGTPHHHYLGFDGSSSGWTEHHQQAEFGRFQRMVAWNAADTTTTGNGGGGSGGGGFLFNALPPPEPLLQPLFSQNQFLTQRGTLQSNNSPSARAWIDPAALSNDQISQFYQHQPAMSGQGFTTPGVVFSGFRIPGQVQGEEESMVASTTSHPPLPLIRAAESPNSYKYHLPRHNYLPGEIHNNGA